MITRPYKLITDIPSYQMILDEFQKPYVSIRKVVYLFTSLGINPGNLNYVLDAVNDEGQSLRDILKSAMNKQYPFTNMGVTHQLTPLQIYLDWEQSSEKWRHVEELKFGLMLGIDINFPINAAGDTVLHTQMRYNSGERVNLKLLIDAGGNINKKNHEGVSPIDLANSSAQRNFLLKVSHKTNPTEESSALVIQRQWRKNKFKSQREKNGTRIDIDVDGHKWAREPAPNPIDKSKLQTWVNSHARSDKKTAKAVAESIQHISYQQFLFGLKLACKKFNEYLASLPPEQRGYMLLHEERENKSPNWVIKLAEKYLEFPPSAVMGKTTGMLRSDPPPNVQHVLVIDDASYSGNLMTDFSRMYFTHDTNKKLRQLQLHFIIPFMSAKAQTGFSAFPIMIHTNETIPTVIKGTKYTASTATFFDHKIPDSEHSAISAIDRGKLVTNDAGPMFVKTITPPYKDEPVIKDLKKVLSQLPKDFALAEQLRETLKKDDSGEFIQLYAKFENDIVAVVGDKIAKLFPQMEHNPNYQLVKLQQMLTQYEILLETDRILLAAQKPADAGLNQKLDEKIDFVKGLAKELKSDKSPEFKLQNFVKEYSEKSSVLGYEAPLVGKKRGKVKSFFKNLESAPVHLEEKKIQDAIAKLLPQVNLILPERKPGR